MYHLIVEPMNHPIMGITTWNDPKLNDIFNAWLKLTLFRTNPVTVATENTSIANPTTMSTIEYRSNLTESPRSFNLFTNKELRIAKIVLISIEKVWDGNGVYVSVCYA